MGKSSDFFHWSKYFLIFIGVILVIRIFLFAPYVVEGISMYPTLKDKERILVNKMIYHVSDPSYGDIIVLHANEEEDYIKRVIGMPGDVLELKNGTLYRNNKVVEEPYISETTLTGFGKLTVPPGSYFVMGDNRNKSMDSREIGFILRKNVVGKAEFIFYPLENAEMLR
jgi:signal peptidase I